MDLNTIWFILVGVLLGGYAVLDGFDLGVGALHLLVKKDLDRRIMINSIGPVWDGNEVWLITGGGALFAAFPHVYATVFSGFYTALMLLLFMIIFRAIAIEFRSKREGLTWRKVWDIMFSVSSILIALLMGVALGNVIIGVPITAEKEAIVGLLDLLNPYAIIVGLTTVALFMMHGAIYAAMKTEGELQEQVKSWINKAIIFFVITYIFTTIATLIYQPHMLNNFKEYPIMWVIVILNMLAIANIPREIHREKYFMAFISSVSSILALMLLFAFGIFPNIVLSSPNPEHSLTIYNAASSQQTLETMLIMAAIGMPFVISYTISIYWIFRGKVKINSMSY